MLTTNHWRAGCHEAVSFISNIICTTQIDFTSLVSVHSYRLQKFQMSSQSSAVYKPYPLPLLPAFSPQGRVQLCADYALLMEISRNVALISILSTYVLLPCSHYIIPWFSCFADKFEKTRLEFQGLIQDCQLAMHKLTLICGTVATLH